MQKIEILRPFRYAALDEVHAVAYEPGVQEVKDEVAAFALAQKVGRPFTEQKPAASAPAKKDDADQASDGKKPASGKQPGKGGQS